MQIQDEAEEHLRVIRSLMEKGTIYRAISAPTALVGGLSSLAFGGWFYLHARTLSESEMAEAPGFDRLFYFGWLSVLAVTVCANAFFIWMAARRRGEPFVSPAMRKALWALFPPMLCGAFFTFTLPIFGGVILTPIWMLFYGLGLLATAQFAPKSIPILGWCFLIAGLFTFKYLCPTTTLDAILLMVLTFGGFHLIYAACTWPRHSAVPQPNEAA